MKILLIRHGHAVEREHWQESELTRPLTQKGIQRLHQSSVAIQALFPNIDQIYSSQLTRSIQTAQILADQYSQSIKQLPYLNPGQRPNLLLPLLSQHQSHHIVAFIGHQPDLSMLTSFLLNSKLDSFFHYKKGALAVLDYQDGECHLESFLPQKLLIALL